LATLTGKKADQNWNLILPKRHYLKSLLSLTMIAGFLLTFNFFGVKQC